MSGISEELAWLYHQHHSRHKDDLPFWRKQVSRRGGPFLELGCGTGRVLLHLADEACPAYGLDKDQTMLKVLHKNIPWLTRQAVHVFQADLTAFRLNRQFPVIILPCNTYTTLSPGERRAALQKVCQHLSSIGSFTASFPNPDHLNSLPSQGEIEVEEVFSHPLDQRPVQVSSSWERVQDQFILHYDYDHLFEDGRVNRLSIQTRHYLTPLPALLDEFENAGLSVRHVYGDYDFSLYTDSSPGLIITATKQ